MTSKLRSGRHEHRAKSRAWLCFLPWLASLLLLPAVLFADGQPAFFIESIVAEGAPPVMSRIAITESALHEGTVYDEPALRQAVARVQRLPFVIDAQFRLARGSVVDRYALIISIRPMTRLFLTSAIDTSWFPQDHFANGPSGPVVLSTSINQSRASELVIGSRWFLGSKGVFNLAAQVAGRDRYTATYTQYDLFGTRASISGVVSFLHDPGARNRPGPDGRDEWRTRHNLTWELIGILPVGDNDSIRASWERSQRPIRYLEPSARGGPYHQVLRPLPETRTEVYWIHDTTDDPLFPTTGTRLTAGGARTIMPSAGLIEVGQQTLEELRATLERSWSLTAAQALTAGMTGWNFDAGKIREGRCFLRYAFDLTGNGVAPRDGELHLEVTADRDFRRVIHQHQTFADSTLKLSLVHRNVWGVVRFDLDYHGWEKP